MGKANIYTGIVMLIGCTYLIFEAHNLEYMIKNVPGPGFLPLWLGILLAFCALLMIYSGFRGKAKEKDKSCSNKKKIRNTVVVLGSAVIAMLLTKILGLLICVGLLTGYLSWALGMKNLKTDILLGILTPVVFWIIFTAALDIQFPVGIFGF